MLTLVKVCQDHAKRSTCDPQSEADIATIRSLWANRIRQTSRQVRSFLPVAPDPSSSMTGPQFKQRSVTSYNGASGRPIVLETATLHDDRTHLFTHVAKTRSSTRGRKGLMSSPLIPWR